jgi:hypothetical protein
MNDKVSTPMWFLNFVNIHSLSIIYIAHLFSKFIVHVFPSTVSFDKHRLHYFCCLVVSFVLFCFFETGFYYVAQVGQ